MSNGHSHNDLRWYVIYSHPKQEDRADSNLRAWGVETLNPKLKSSGSNPWTNAPIQTTKSLFPRYLFARFKTGELLTNVSYTRGVHSVVTFGKEPVPVDDEIIKIIRSRMAEDGFVRIDEEFEPGDPVLIKSGSFRSFMGIFDRKVKNTDRVRILLETLSYEGHLEIERDAVTKIHDYRRTS